MNEIKLFTLKYGFSNMNQKFVNYNKLETCELFFCKNIRDLNKIKKIVTDVFRYYLANIKQKYCNQNK